MNHFPENILIYQCLVVYYKTIFYYLVYFLENEYRCIIKQLIFCLKYKYYNNNVT